MGRYADMLREHQKFMQFYSPLMDDYGRAWNENKLFEYQLLAQEEMKKEITKEVLANISKGSGKAAKDIAKEIQSALNSIKL